MFISTHYNTVTFESVLTLDQMRNLRRYNPDALVLKKDKEPIFAMDYTIGEGSVNNNGIVLDSFKNDGKMFMTIDLYMADLNEEQKRKVIRDRFGVILAHAKEIEDQCIAALGAVEATLQSVENDIHID